MPYDIAIKIGATINLKISNESLTSALEVAGFWGEVAVKCKGRPNLAFFHRTPKGFKYYGIIDLDRNEELTFGQLKEGGFYLSEEKDWQPCYQKSRPGEEPQRDAPSDYNQEPGPDDVPPDMQPQAPARPAAPAAPRTWTRPPGQAAPPAAPRPAPANISGAPKRW